MSFWYKKSKYAVVGTVKSTYVYQNDTNITLAVSGYGIDRFLSAASYADGRDIVVTDTIGNKLEIEKVTFDRSIGDIILWVKIPSISSTYGGQFIIQCGDSEVNESNSTDTWDSSVFNAVFHLQSVDGSTVEDSIGVQNGTNYGASFGTSGVIGNCASFDGSNDTRINIERASFSATTGALECWFKSNEVDPSENKYIISRNRAGVYDGDVALWNNNNGNVNGFFTQDGVNTRNVYQNDTNDTSWHHMSGIWASSEIFLMYDGEKQVDTGIAQTLASHESSYKFGIGGANGGTDFNDQFYNGLIDEVRIRKVAPTKNHIKTIYANQNGFSTNASFEFSSLIIREQTTINNIFV